MIFSLNVCKGGVSPPTTLQYKGLSINYDPVKIPEIVGFTIFFLHFVKDNPDSHSIVIIFPSAVFWGKTKPHCSV